MLKTQSIGLRGAYSHSILTDTAGRAENLDIWRFEIVQALMFLLVHFYIGGIC
jgi:hypothetical protein